MNNTVTLTFNFTASYERVVQTDISSGRNWKIPVSAQRIRNPRVQQKIREHHVMADAFSRNLPWDTAYSLLKGFKFFYENKDIEYILDEFFIDNARTVVNSIGNLTPAAPEEFPAKVRAISPARCLIPFVRNKGNW